MAKRSKSARSKLSSEVGLDDSALAAVVGGAGAPAQQQQKQTDDAHAAIAASAVAAAMTQAEQHAATPAAPDPSHPVLDTNHTALDAANLAHAAQPITVLQTPAVVPAADPAHMPAQSATQAAPADHAATPADHAGTPAAPAHPIDLTAAKQALADADKTLAAEKDAVAHATSLLTSDQAKESSAEFTVKTTFGSRHGMAIDQYNVAHAHVVADQTALTAENVKLQAVQQAHDAAAQTLAQAEAQAQAAAQAQALAQAQAQAAAAQAAAAANAPHPTVPAPAADPHPAVLAATSASSVVTAASHSEVSASPAPSVAAATQALADAKAALAAEQDAAHKASAQVTVDQQHLHAASFGSSAYNAAKKDLAADQSAVTAENTKVAAAQQTYDAAVQTLAQAQAAAAQAATAPSAPAPSVTPAPVADPHPAMSAPVPVTPAPAVDPHAATPPATATPAPAPGADPHPAAAPAPPTLSVAAATQALTDAKAALTAEQDAAHKASAQVTVDQQHLHAASFGSSAYKAAQKDLAADQSAVTAENAKVTAAQQTYDAAVQTLAQAQAAAAHASTAPSAPPPAVTPAPPAPAPVTPAPPAADVHPATPATPAPVPATPAPAVDPHPATTPAANATSPAADQPATPAVAAATQALADAKAALVAEQDAMQKASAQLASDQAKRDAAAKIGDFMGYGAALAAMDKDQPALSAENAKLAAAQHTYDAALQGLAQAQAAAAQNAAPSAPADHPAATPAPAAATQALADAQATLAAEQIATQRASGQLASDQARLDAAAKIGDFIGYGAALTQSGKDQTALAAENTKLAAAQHAYDAAVQALVQAGGTAPQTAAPATPPAGTVPQNIADILGGAFGAAPGAPSEAVPSAPSMPSTGDHPATTDPATPPSTPALPPATAPHVDPATVTLPPEATPPAMTGDIATVKPPKTGNTKATGLDVNTITNLKFPDSTYGSAGAGAQNGGLVAAASGGTGFTSVVSLDNGVTLGVKAGAGGYAQATVDSYGLLTAAAGGVAGAAAVFDFGSGATLTLGGQAQGSLKYSAAGLSGQGSAGLYATFQEQQSADLGSQLSLSTSAGVTTVVGVSGTFNAGLTGVSAGTNFGAVVMATETTAIQVGGLKLAETLGVTSPGALSAGLGLTPTFQDGVLDIKVNLSLSLGFGGINLGFEVGLDFGFLDGLLGESRLPPPFDPIKAGLDELMHAPPSAAADTVAHAQQLATDFLHQQGATLTAVGDPPTSSAIDAAKMIVTGQPQLNTSAAYHFDVNNPAHRAAYAQDFINKAYDTIDANHLTGAAADMQIRAASIVAEDFLGANGASKDEIAKFAVDRVNVMLQHDQKEMDNASAADKPYFQRLYAEHQADATKAVIDLYVSNGSWQAGLGADPNGANAIPSTQAHAAESLAKFGGGFPDNGYADHVSADHDTLLSTARALVDLQPHPPESSPNYEKGVIEGAYAFIRDHNLTGSDAQRQVDAAVYMAEQHYIDRHGTGGFNAAREGFLNQVIAHDSTQLMIGAQADAAQVQHALAVNQLSAYVSHSYAQVAAGNWSPGLTLDAAGVAAMHTAQAQFASTDGPGPANWTSDASLKAAALTALADQPLPHALAANASKDDAMQYAKDLLTSTYADIAQHGLTGSDAQSRINAAVYLGKVALHDHMPANATVGDLAIAFSQQAQQHLIFDQIRLGTAGDRTHADAQSGLIATTMEVQTLSSQAIALADKNFSYDNLDKAEHDGMAQLAAATTDAQKAEAYATALQGIANVPAKPTDYASAMTAAHDLVEMAYASIEARAASGKATVDGGAAFLLEAARHIAEKWVMDTHPSPLEQAKFNLMEAQQKLQHDQMDFAAATGAERTALGAAIQADMVSLKDIPAQVAALQATENMLGPHKATGPITGTTYDTWSTQVMYGGGSTTGIAPDYTQGHGGLANNGPRTDAAAAAGELQTLLDKYHATTDATLASNIMSDILVTSRAVMMNYPHPVENAITETHVVDEVHYGVKVANTESIIVQSGSEQPQTFARDVMQSCYAYIEKNHLGKDAAAPYIQAAQAYLQAVTYVNGGNFVDPDRVAKTNLGIAQAALDEHTRQMVLAAPEAKAELAKEAYQDRLDVAKFTSQAAYYDAANLPRSMPPAAAQQMAQGALDGGATPLEAYHLVLQGQPQPGLRKVEPYEYQANLEAQAQDPTVKPIDAAALNLHYAKTYATQLVDLAFATIDVKGLTGAQADLQIRAAMAVGEDAIKNIEPYGGTPLDVAEYRVLQANQILQHTQQKIELYGNQNGLDAVATSNQAYLLQALEDVFKLDARVSSAVASGDATAISRAKQTVTQEILMP